MTDYITTCERAVRAAGVLVRDWAGEVDAREKAPADLVTEVDMAAQEEVRRILHEAFPDHSLVGEEGQRAAPAADRAEFRWIVDPLDGTTNYVHRVPHYSVSLALERKGELLVGAVYDPIREECFTAAAGEGAFLNGRPVRTSGVSDLADALAAVGFPPRADENDPDVRLFLEVIRRCQSIRRTGSQALNLCYLAAGRFDVCWSFSTKIWDVAAGALMIREAGGVVSSPRHDRFRLETGQILAAATEPLHARLRELAAGL